MLSRKKDPDGRDERLRLLVERGGLADAGDILLGPRPAGVAYDDLLDAFAACWTAGRTAGGEGVRVPEPSEVDSRGLRMEIWR